MNTLWQRMTLLFAIGLSLFQISIRTTPARADSWTRPVVRFFLSDGGAFGVRIVPKDRLGQLKTLSQGSQPGVRERANIDKPYAEIYRRTLTGAYQLGHSFDLVNRISPVSAIVSNDGQYLVTFDNWHSIGGGDHVVVIYLSDGTLVRSLRLTDIMTEGDIGNLSRSVSSVTWSGPNFIDGDDLVLRLATCARREPECSNRYEERRFELSTGLPRTDIVDLLPRWEPRVSLLPKPSMTADPENQSTTQCRAGWTEQSFQGAQQTPFADLLPEEPLELPAYSKKAIRGMIRGHLRFELLVSANGEVVCVRNSKPLPYGLTPLATETLLSWQLAPPGLETLLESSVTLNYDLVLVPPAH